MLRKVVLFLEVFETGQNPEQPAAVESALNMDICLDDFQRSLQAPSNDTVTMNKIN